MYFTVHAAEAMRIVGVDVDASVAGEATIHETVAADPTHDHGEHDHDDEGEDRGQHGSDVMTMQAVDAVDVPADGKVAFEPGGLHVMLVDLADPLQRGESFEVTLTLASGESLTVDVEVRDDAP